MQNHESIERERERERETKLIFWPFFFNFTAIMEEPK